MSQLITVGVQGQVMGALFYRVPTRLQCGRWERRNRNGRMIDRFELTRCVDVGESL